MHTSRTITRTPSLRRHAPSGLAVVTIDRHDYYLGDWPAEAKKPPAEAQSAYDRLVAEWLANGRRLPIAAGTTDPFTVNELILAFYRHAEQHYRHADGTPTNELRDYRLSLRPLQELYGDTPALEFSPLKLKAVRQRMIDAQQYRVRPQETPEAPGRWLAEADVKPDEGRAKIGKKWQPVEILDRRSALSRGVINQRISRLVRMFRWGVSEEMVPETTYRALATVGGLDKGRCNVRETEPVKPVHEAHVEAVLPHVLPPVAAMIQLQRLTGARPGEVCILRGCDLDVSGPVWLYRPEKHKTQHRGKERVIPLGPQAQAVVKPFLKLDTQAYLFSPKETMAEQRKERSAKRKTRPQPSQVRRARRKKKDKLSECYTVCAYDQAIARACIEADVPHWHPHQLRHAHATEVRKRYGLEAAQVSLGHSQAAVTQIYAERDLSLAAKVAAEMG